MHNTKRFTKTVNATFENVWKILMDDVEHPAEFSKTILKSKIIERFHNGVLRVVSVPDADVRQRITFDYEHRKIRSELVGHPSLVGTITEELSGTDNVMIECEVEWASIDKGVGEMVRRNVEFFISERIDNVKKRAEGTAP
jgi:hypothetical protein